MHGDSDIDIFDAVVHVERDAFRFGVESARASPSVGSEQFEEGLRTGYVSVRPSVILCPLLLIYIYPTDLSQVFSWLRDSIRDCFHEDLCRRVFSARCFIISAHSLPGRWSWRASRGHPSPSHRSAPREAYCRFD
jgi:hypothetical protein